MRAAVPACPNGHPADVGDLLCPTCGADIDDQPAQASAPEPEGATVIDGWLLGERLPSHGRAWERFRVVNEAAGEGGVLTLYNSGSEPDSAVYDVLNSLSFDHVPRIMAVGRWEDRAYEVGEEITGGTLAELGLLPDDSATLSRVVEEVGKALHGFAEHGLRHRDLSPQAIIIRSREPLDLVITNFGSARLSDFDLDVVAPLETNRYTAPEAIAGGVAAASDWWSLGMILLEQITRGACFEGVNEQAFLIHVLTNGAPIPDGIEPRLELLLRGLLARDRRERWSWDRCAEMAGRRTPYGPGVLRHPGDGGCRRPGHLTGGSFLRRSVLFRPRGRRPRRVGRGARQVTPRRGADLGAGGRSGFEGPRRPAADGVPRRRL